MHGHQSNRPSFKSHLRTHEEILTNEKWFGDGEPVIGEQFTSAKARERKGLILRILWRAYRKHRNVGDNALARPIKALAEKLKACRPQAGCGSLACPECSRAFQRAKVAGQTIAINRMQRTRTGKHVVMASVIPLWKTYSPEQLGDLEVRKLNRWLKDALTRNRFKRVMLGSFDLSWEADRRVYQPHWHIAMFTSNRKELKRRLKLIFPSQESGDRPVVVSKTYSLGFLPYKDKAIKIVELLRNNRRGLPRLLLALDRTDPMELVVLMRLRVSAHNGELQFKPFELFKHNQLSDLAAAFGQ
jgi:hypothetical protein